MPLDKGAVLAVRDNEDTRWGQSSPREAHQKCFPLVIITTEARVVYDAVWDRTLWVRVMLVLDFRRELEEPEPELDKMTKPKVSLRSLGLPSSCAALGT